MKTLLVLAALCSSAVITGHKSRESRNLNWLFGGFNIFGSPSSGQIDDIQINNQRQKLHNTILQRRTSQISADDQNRDIPRARVLNRPPPKVGGPVKGYQPPKRPPLSFERKPNIAAPIIISSYASTSIQGRGQDDEERIRDKIDQYEKLNDISTDDVEQKEEKVKVEGPPETETVEVTETDEIVTTQKIIEDPTTKSLGETTEQVITADYDITAESPYLPDIPDNLDDELHGVHLAGYQEVPEAEGTSGVDRTEQLQKKKEINPQPSVFPLGKPKPLVPIRPPFKPSNKARPPSKSPEPEGSLFDFFSFWGSSREDKKPRRPAGPQQPPAPAPLRPVKDQTGEELPVRPDFAVQPSISSRIDSSISTDSKANDVEAYIVLPTQELKPKPDRPSRIQIGPKRPVQPFNGPRLPPARARVPPPPPRPLLGLPRVPPASRKQVPFLAKRPLLPPKVPAEFAGSQTQAQAQAPETSNASTLKKPLDKLFKKAETLSPKVIAKLTSQTKVYEGKKPFDFRPNGSHEKPSQISSHLSSFMNFLFQTTPSPAPAPSLPSLVEDTEFADIVHGYKPSDKNLTESVYEAKENEISPTTPASKTKLKPSGNKKKIDIYEELDSLTAPVPDKPQNIKKLIKSKRPPLQSPATHFQQKRPVLRQKLKPTTIKIPTTTTGSTLASIKSTTAAQTTRSSQASSSSTSTFPGPIQALVEEYQQKGHVVSQETYAPPVLMAIKKNFEHKKNIFEQFVTFNENDKAFIPNKEVVSSDWSVDSLHSLDTEDKILVYQTLPTTSAAAAPTARPAATSAGAPGAPDKFPDKSLRRNSGPNFPNERNAEGGFRPMIRPLHSPLLNQ